MAATGITAGSIVGGAVSFSNGWQAGLYCVFVAIAAFTLIGAFGAMIRTLPALSFLYRTPSKKAPTQSELLTRVETAKRKNYQRIRK